MPIFSSKDKDGYRSVNLMAFDGISIAPKGMMVNVTLFDNSLLIKQRIGKHATAELDYSQIVNAEIISQKEIEEKNKSVIGRGVVGGLVFGPLGAVVGAVSGVGKKSKSKSKSFVLINYIPSSSKEVQAISFEVVGATMGIYKFMSELRKKCNINSVFNNQEHIKL